MQVTNINHHGNTTTISSTTYNGPIGHIKGIIFSSFICLVGILLTLLNILLCIQYLKIKDFPSTQAVIVNRDNDPEMENFTLAYNIAGQDYTYDKAFKIDKNIGESITIYYNPANHKDIYWDDSKPNFMFALLAFLFDTVGVSALVRNIKKLLHFINPQKYEEVKDEDDTMLAFGEGGFKNSPFDDEYSEGSHTEIKF